MKRDFPRLVLAAVVANLALAATVGILRAIVRALFGEIRIGVGFGGAMPDGMGMMGGDMLGDEDTPNLVMHVAIGGEHGGAPPVGQDNEHEGEGE